MCGGTNLQEVSNLIFSSDHQGTLNVGRPVWHVSGRMAEGYQHEMLLQLCHLR